jgi:hypothetical protein
MRQEVQGRGARPLEEVLRIVQLGIERELLVVVGRRLRNAEAPGYRLRWGRDALERSTRRTRI